MSNWERKGTIGVYGRKQSSSSGAGAVIGGILVFILVVALI